MRQKNTYDFEWQFSTEDKAKAIQYFNENGFVAFPDLMKENDVNRLRAAYDEAFALGALEANRDFIFFHQTFEEYVTDKRLCSVLELLFEDGFDLQHSKLNAKNITGALNLGHVDWHQDYPFFPLTNFDLVAVSIYLDDEDGNSGCLEFIPGSHKHGLLSHCDYSNTFAYKCTEIEYFENKNSIPLVGKRGTVTFHHCLALHMSKEKLTPGPRRRLIFQYKAEDAVQLAGVIWKSYGYPIRSGKSKGYARFPDGTKVEIRGEKGRLVDIEGSLLPDP